MVVCSLRREAVEVAVKALISVSLICGQLGESKKGALQHYYQHVYAMQSRTQCALDLAYVAIHRRQCCQCVVFWAQDDIMVAWQPVSRHPSRCWNEAQLGLLLWRAARWTCPQASGLQRVSGCAMYLLRNLHQV
eukprot:scaffold75667_cov48-Prasinocladus_malaysianus.AAC.2